jgi:glutamate 5-kinase
VRVVVKIGTSSITNDLGRIREEMVTSLCDQVAALRHDGHEVLVVSSGAVASGVAALGMAERPGDTLTLQAVSAVGQSRLMSRYDAALSTHGLTGAQVLLVPNDFIDRRQYLHARDTLQRLLDLGCVPIINENDAIASDEIRFSDNDRIAALVAHSVGADVLVLLTDIAGLYTANPMLDTAAELIAEVGADDPLLAVDAGSSGTNRGSGGMASKLAAARIASSSGVQTVIAAASRPDVLVDAVAGRSGVGTRFVPRRRELSARKLWIAYAAQAAGSIVVDDGAARALLTRNVSLLHAGVTGVHGTFDVGDTVDIVSPDGAVIARGMVAVPADVARLSAGRRSAELGEGVSPEVVHRDDLVNLATAIQ